MGSTARFILTADAIVLPKEEHTTKARKVPKGYRRLAPIKPPRRTAQPRLRAAIRRGLKATAVSVAKQIRAHKVEKVGPEDEARDDRGRWTAGGGGGDDKNLVVYHGSFETVVASVAEKGLTVRGNRRNFGSEEYVGERGQSVYVSKDLGEARGWPVLGENAPRGATPVVFRVSIPEGESVNLKEDEYRSGDGTSYRFVGNIPPSWITGYSVQDRRTFGWSDWKSLKKSDGELLYAVIVVGAPPEITKAKSDKAQRLAQEISDALDLGELSVIVADAEELLTLVGKDAAEDALAQVGVDDSDIVNAIDERAAAWAEERAAELVGMRYDENGDLVESSNAMMRIDDTTRDMVRAAIADGLDDGKTLSEIADDVMASGAFSEDRADLIASTEVRRAHSNGALIGYKAAAADGVNVLKSWSTAGDDLVDEEVCGPNEDDGPIPLDDVFQSGDDAPPGHPNCRCSLVPYVADQDEEE